MTQQELSDLSGIRERLRALEARLADHSRASAERHTRTDEDLKELTKTVIRLSETVATLTVSINSHINQSASTVAVSNPTPASAVAAASSISGGSVALIGYYVLKALGL
jgi:hypothetical protein